MKPSGKLLHKGVFFLSRNAQPSGQIGMLTRVPGAAASNCRADSGKWWSGYAGYFQSRTIPTNITAVRRRPRDEQ